MNDELEEVMKRIESNAERIESNLEKIQKNNYALEILGDYKTESLRLFDINKKLIRLVYVLLIILIALGIFIIIK